jgi:NAD(P)-dependent dehydrogenase (short-subunit alcohol dehydrogenase family)
MVCDVADDASVKSAFERAASLGDIECVVFNASPGFPKDPKTGEPFNFT